MKEAVDAVAVFSLSGVRVLPCWPLIIAQPHRWGTRRLVPSPLIRRPPGPPECHGKGLQQ